MFFHFLFLVFANKLRWMMGIELKQDKI